MFGILERWDWLLCLAFGALTLLMGYGILPMDEAFYKKNRRIVRTAGFFLILCSILQLVFGAGAPSRHG